ncbi:hypothetical protein [Mycolicibacterium goodii]|uniref:hypothetical protein n=1 Tax=Mycolicibacterium goodii TaxID=134601 RepID=UPI001BDBB4DC|nr:hypothetical protein [Mycolicibacterium goodii]MBU8834612.1 hypothetical protein [Mycolicibacterium goodii]
MNEVEIYAGPDRDRFGETPFGMVCSAPRALSGEIIDPAPPVTVAYVEFVAECLRPAGAVWHGVRHTVTPDGYLRVEAVNGTWIWELMPARWSDGAGGPLYVCVWRD